MDLLFIGGTVFVGRHAVEAAVQRGHRVTVFHRGSKGPISIEGVQEILGDRDGDLAALEGRSWDAVLDTCGYVPRIVSLSAEKLRHSVGRYLFVSTISIFEETEEGGLREPATTAPLATEEVTGETYGPLKARCEQVVQEIYGDRALIIRPGLVAGPFDPTNRFTYWVERFVEHAQVVVPDRAEQPIQLIDARDLGLFMVLALENELSGVFEVTGEQLTFGQMIDACHALNPNTQILSASEEFLEANEVGFWTDLPLCMPSKAPTPLLEIDSSHALKAGLKRRPLAQTAADTAIWSKSRPHPEKEPYGMTRLREQELIEKLKS